MLEFLEFTGVTETPGVTQLVTFGWFGTEAVCMFWLNGLPRRGSPEALCFTELVMLCKIGTEEAWSPVGQNFTALEIFEVTVVCMFWVNGLPRWGGPEVSCFTELVMLCKIGTEVIWSPVGQNFTALEIFEVTVVTEAPRVIELVTFVCSGTVGLPKRGNTEAACVTDLARRQNIRTEVN